MQESTLVELTSVSLAVFTNDSIRASFIYLVTGFLYPRDNPFSPVYTITGCYGKSHI